MNKKLRLLVTDKCPNKCPMCCNNSWDFDKLPVVETFDYDEIMITGGEPLLYIGKVVNICKAIKTLDTYREKDTKIYLYTSVCNYEMLSYILQFIDGVVVTPHTKEAVKDLERMVFLFNKDAERTYNYLYDIKTKSLRLNLFSDMKDILSKEIDLSLWNVKGMKWIKDCPVPEGEDFKRIKTLWK